ncbi:hypothetical protein OAG24_00605 [bacterium]|nr:hypothetical protein [bacterium]
MSDAIMEEQNNEFYDYKQIPNFSRYLISQHGDVFDNENQVFIESTIADAEEDSSGIYLEGESPHDNFVYIFDDNNIQECVSVQKIIKENFNNFEMENNEIQDVFVAHFSCEGKLLNIFSSINAASNASGIDVAEIEEVLSGRINSTRNTTWIPLNPKISNEINITFEKNLHCRTRSEDFNFKCETSVKCIVSPQG